MASFSGNGKVRCHSCSAHRHHCLKLRLPLLRTANAVLPARHRSTSLSAGLRGWPRDSSGARALSPAISHKPPRHQPIAAPAKARLFVHHGRESEPSTLQSTKNRQRSWIDQRLRSSEGAVDFAHEANMEGFGGNSQTLPHHESRPGTFLMGVLSDQSGSDVSTSNEGFPPERGRPQQRPKSMWNVQGFEGFISKAASQRTPISGYRRNNGTFLPNLRNVLQPEDALVLAPAGSDAGGRRESCPATMPRASESDQGSLQSESRGSEKDANEDESLIHCPLNVRQRVRQWHLALKDYSWEHRASALRLSPVSRRQGEERGGGTILRADDLEIAHFRQEAIWGKPAEWWASTHAGEKAPAPLALSRSQDWKRGFSNKKEKNSATDDRMHAPADAVTSGGSETDGDDWSTFGANENWNHSAGDEGWQASTANDDLEEFFASLKLEQRGREGTDGHRGLPGSSRLEEIAGAEPGPGIASRPREILDSEGEASGSEIGCVDAERDRVGLESGRIGGEGRWPLSWPQAGDNCPMLAQLPVPDPLFSDNLDPCAVLNGDDDREIRSEGLHSAGKNRGVESSMTEAEVLDGKVSQSEEATRSANLESMVQEGVEQQTAGREGALDNTSRLSSWEEASGEGSRDTVLDESRDVAEFLTGTSERGADTDSFRDSDTVDDAALFGSVGDDLLGQWPKASAIGQPATPSSGGFGDAPGAGSAVSSRGKEGDWFSQWPAVPASGNPSDRTFDDLLDAASGVGVEENWWDKSVASSARSSGGAQSADSTAPSRGKGGHGMEQWPAVPAAGNPSENGFDDLLNAASGLGVEDGWWDRQAGPLKSASGHSARPRAFDDIFGPSYDLMGRDEDLFGGKEWIGPDHNARRSDAPYHAEFMHNRRGDDHKNFSFTLGDREFLSSSGLRQHFQRILRQRTPLTVRQQEDVLELIYQGHPDPRSKFGAGVIEVFAGGHPKHGSPCFLLRRRDRSIVDVSFNKCVTLLAERGGQKRGDAKQAGVF